MSSNLTNIPIKIVLLGQSATGKTCIATRYVKGTFLSSSVSTVGASYLTKSATVDGITYDLNIWDTAGQELYRSLTPMYYRNAHAAIVVFDITNRQSFEAARRWIEELRGTGENSFIVIVGNKIDLEDARQVTEQDGNSLANELKCKYIETSALSGVGIELLFQIVIKGINELPQLKGKLNKDQVEINNLEGNKENNKKGCC